MFNVAVVSNANQLPELPPLKVNVTTDAKFKPEAGLWYYVNADESIDFLTDVISNTLKETNGTFAGTKTIPILARTNIAWSKPYSHAERDKVYENGMNYVGDIAPYCPGPVIWGNHTVSGGVLSDLVTVAVVLHEISKAAREFQRVDRTFSADTWRSLQQKAESTIRCLCNLQIPTPGSERFLEVELYAGGLLLTFPNSALDGVKNKSFHIRVAAMNGEFYFNAEPAVIECIDAVVSMDWILMG